MTLFLLALLTGCANPSDNGPLGPARVEESCGPADGAALEFVFGLAEDSCDATLSMDGWLRIMIWDKSWDGLEAKDLPIDAVVYSEDGVNAVDGSEGWVEIDELDGDSISGRYLVRTDKGEWIQGTFDSLPYCEGEEMCG